VKDILSAPNLSYPKLQNPNLKRFAVWAKDGWETELSGL